MAKAKSKKSLSKVPAKQIVAKQLSDKWATWPSWIDIKGAREHNLKDISLKIPRDQLVVIAGVSGSGKSSLAFDTIYAEGQRRYVESLSAYARQFLGQMEKPDVDSIDGLSPSISIDQKGTSRNPRSTVATVTEIYDYMRLLFARVGTPHCPVCDRIVERQTIDQMADRALAFPVNTKLQILGPVIEGRKGEYKQLLENVAKQGFTRVRVDKQVYVLGEEEIPLEKNKKHTIEVVVDRIVVSDQVRTRLVDSMDQAVKIGKGSIILVPEKGEEVFLSQALACPYDGTNLGELEPRNFSFNSPYGACPECSGLGGFLDADPDLVVPDPNLTLAKGAIAPWRTEGTEKFLKEFCAFNKIAMDIPYRLLPQSAQKLLMNGQSETYRKGWGFDAWLAREGALGMIRTRHKETNSDRMKEDLERYMSVRPCSKCNGARLKKETLAVRIAEHNISQVVSLSVIEANRFYQELKLDPRQELIAKAVLKEIRERLQFLVDVGLDYLTLDRSAATLSGGESQRIRLATQIGSRLQGITFVLDEPSVGLHARDNDRLIATMQRLKDIGNTVLIVEHDEDTIRAADWIVEIGPGAGMHGGHVIASQPREDFLVNPKALTAQYLNGTKGVAVPKSRRTGSSQSLIIRGARANNLKNIDVKFPLGCFIGITGVSGSGKSSLISDILVRRLSQHFYRAKDKPGAHDKIEGLDYLDKIVVIDQSPIGRTPRSNPATYTKTFDLIRDLFANLPESKMRGYLPGRFSFNVPGGRCEACTGDGIIKIEMQFLPDVYVPCEQCHGSRYSREVQTILFRNHSIADVLQLTVEEALGVFDKIPAIHRKLVTLRDVGLGYIHLGQPATQLSGGEAQRVKLALELARRDTGKTIFSLDEPTTGLHPADIEHLLSVLHHLVDRGNTVIVIEHNLEVIKTADWVIDLGPEGGVRGGYLVAEGTPEQIVRNKKSYTGHYLAPHLQKG